MGKGAPSSASIPEVQEPTPVAPANPPITESSAEVAQAAAEEKTKQKKSFGSSKTVIAGGFGLGSSGSGSSSSGGTGSKTLGGGA